MKAIVSNRKTLPFMEYIKDLFPEERRTQIALFRYALDSLEYSAQMNVSPVPQIGIQGIAYSAGRFYLATGPGGTTSRVTRLP